MLIGPYEPNCVAVPENGYPIGALVTPVAPKTRFDACKIGVKAEIANRDPYDGKRLPADAAYPDITLVMQRLRDASEENHLPAFQRCVNRG